VKKNGGENEDEWSAPTICGGPLYDCEERRRVEKTKGGKAGGEEKMELEKTNCRYV